MIKIEQEFNVCVCEIGGVKISDIVGSAPSFLNADYLFPQYSVVAELKSLEENLIKSEKIKRKATDIYDRYVREGGAPTLPPGATKISDKNFPEEFKREIFELYRGSVHTAIKKANKQIKLTKANLKHDNHHGLLILANNNHTALDPGVAMWIIGNTLDRYSFGSIDSVLYFTANLHAEHPNIARDVLVWIAGNREPTNKCPRPLLDRLQKSWVKRVSFLTGEPIFEHQVDKIEIINDLSNI